MTQTERKEIESVGYKLLEKLLEHNTLKTLDTNLEELGKKVALFKPNASDRLKIRIELATLHVMNMLKEYGLSSLKQDNYKNAFDITEKVSKLKPFHDQEKILSDG